MARSGYFEAMLNSILETGIMEMGRQSNGKPFKATDVLKWIYPEDWRHFMPDIQEEITRLKELNKICITQDYGVPPMKGEVEGDVWIIVIQC